ncbi:MAG: hypothetical protein F6K14_12705 [Symploca sp. SIO2C1]|nr:hypothetical protein [Symploca sp. SIO2C1]
MKKRRALLIGVPEYESDAIKNLPVVCQDLEALNFSLEQSGYRVSSLGTDNASQLTRNKIRYSLRRECREAKGIEILLLYFSGHGLHYNGRDYLVPADAFLDDPESIEEYLVSTDLSNIIDQADAKTIIFVIDACREGVKLGVKQTYLASWSRGERNKASKRNFVVVFACGSGQVSQYVRGEAGFSLFSKALAEVLDPQHPACTLGEVLEATKSRLDALVTEHGKQAQQIHYCFESLVDTTPLSQVICESLTAKALRGENSYSWAEAALESSLWQDEETEENSNSTSSRLKQQFIRILTACWQQWQASIQAMPNDPWRDENLPIRVLESLELLVLRSNPPVQLSAAEVALVIAVPFVREAVLASALVQAAKTNPLACEATDTTGSFRDSLQKLHQSEPRFFRKAKRLEEQGQIAEKDAVMSWLVHRCLRKSLEVWIPESEGGYLADDFVKALQKFGKCSTRLVRDALNWKRSLELARCTLVDPERIDREDRPNALQSRLIVGSYREEQPIREKMLAYLLKMAWLLAIDTRHLSTVLVDHIGMADPLDLQDLHRLVNSTQTRWNPVGVGRNLTATCHHPAIDVALKEHLQQADEFLGQILRRIGERRGEMEALAGFPKHLMSDGIIAARDNSGPVYQKPHINFQLAHDEIRELLMGEQLYGDPGLAIRELYQNALDACRYRAARLEYLTRVDGETRREWESQPRFRYQDSAAWQGQIIFRQEKDENGREYIECQDNGIGMDMEHLSKCFASAGRRFADLPEFIEEQAAWLKCDPPIKLYPNSQFGVGVLSYFMLADEIEVETCRLDHQGKPGEKLLVRIPGSSGLFRVQPLGIGSDSGTRVRLYLNRTHHEGQRISCIEILRQLLWIAEFPTEVRQGARREIWEVNQLKHPYLPQHHCLRAGDNLWWVAHEYRGCILSDGLRTEERQSGVVVNLHQDYYPRLTVDRKKIVEYDKKYVQDLLIQGAEVLQEWEFLSLSWLWEFSEEYPNVGCHIVHSILQKRPQLRLGTRNFNNLEISILQVGCFEMDSNLLKGNFSYRDIISCMPWWIIPYRILLWKRYGLVRLSNACLESIPPSMRSEYCPVLDPIDAAIFNSNIGHVSRYLSYINFDVNIPPAQIIFAAWYLNQPIREILQRLQRFAALGLELASIDQNIPDELVITEKDVIAFSTIINRKDKDPWNDKYIPIGQLVLASARINEPIAQTLARYQKFAFLGLEIPEVEPQSLVDLMATPEDVVIFSSRLDGKYPYPSRKHNRLSLSHLVEAARKLNEPISATWKQVERFVPLGIDLPKIDIESWENLNISSEELDAYEPFIDTIGHPKPDWNLAAALVFAATRLNETLAQTFSRFQNFKELEPIVPEVDLALLEKITITPEDAILLSEELDGRAVYPSKRIAVVHIITAAAQLKETIEQVIQRLQRFEFLGLEIPEIDEDLTALTEFIADNKNLIALSERLTGRYPLLKGEIHLARVVVAACELDEPVPVTLERMRRFAHLFEITLPESL